MIAEQWVTVQQCQSPIDSGTFLFWVLRRKNLGTSDLWKWWMKIELSNGSWVSCLFIWHVAYFPSQRGRAERTEPCRNDSFESWHCVTLLCSVVRLCHLPSAQQGETLNSSSGWSHYSNVTSPTYDSECLLLCLVIILIENYYIVFKLCRDINCKIEVV